MATELSFMRALKQGTMKTDVRTLDFRCSKLRGQGAIHKTDKTWEKRCLWYSLGDPGGALGSMGINPWESLGLGAPTSRSAWESMDHDLSKEKFKRRQASKQTNTNGLALEAKPALLFKGLRPSAAARQGCTEVYPF